LNCIEIHPNNEDIIYVGASNGGIWKTTNGGTSWTNVTPNLPLLSIADIKIDPNNTSIVYALTGDGDPVPGEGDSHSQTEVSSIGIIRSTNSGGTWYPTGFSFEHPSTLVPIKLLIHPSNSSIQFVVSKDGIYRTNNAWSTNSLVFTSNTFDIEFKPGSPSTMYASGSNWIRRSTNTGLDWDLISDTDFSAFSGSTRIELAVTPDFPNLVYALGGNWSEMKAFMRSLSSGADDTWSLRDDATTTLGKFATYCIGLAVDPDDYTDVFGGMQWINRSLSGGSAGTWSSIVNSSVHADIHDIVKTADNLYVACDGGIWKSDDDGDTWTDLSAGLHITEIYRIAGTPQNFSLYYMGCQDNGTYERTIGSTFEKVSGADGMTCAIDYTNSDIVYASSQNGNFKKSTDGGDNFSSLPVPGSGGQWISPMIIDNVDPDVLFFGKTNCYRSDDGGSTYENLGSPWTGDLNVIAQGTSNRNRLYASRGSTIYRTDEALADGPLTWTNVSSGLPNLFITDIVVDPDNSARVFVTLSGYNDGEKVYRSFNSGVSWTNLSGSLPNVPVNCIAFENGGPSDATYIGTDIGVFYRDNVLGDWIYFSNFLPNVNISDIYFNEGYNSVVAGTYGRGLWRSSSYTGCPLNLFLSNSGSADGGTKAYSATSSVTSHRLYSGELTTNIQYSAGEFIELKPGFRSTFRSTFEAVIGDCPDITSIELTAGPNTSGSTFEFNDWVLRSLAKINN
jgi:photosystem II stability/assembly factor-like uncharacterized protein